MTYEIVLNRLPENVLDVIFAQLDIQELMQLIRNEEFILPNKSILEACLCQIGNRNIIMSNRFIESSQAVMYTRTKSYLDKSSLEFLTQERDIYALIEVSQRVGKRCKIRTITLSYTIWDLRDMNQFMRLVKSIMPSSLRFNIELEFHPGILYLIDLNQVLKVISSRLEPNVETLQIVNFVQEAIIDISQFPSLERLWIENSNIKFKTSFRKTKKLQTLVISPNYNRLDVGKPVVIKKTLPTGIQYLKLGQCIIDMRSLDYGIPSNIKSMSLNHIKDLTDGQYLENLLEANLLSELEDITFSDVIQNRISSDSILKTVMNLGQMKSIDVSNVRERNFEFGSSNLKKLGIQKSRIEFLSVPQCLKKLNISNNGLRDIGFVQLPPTLEVLNLSDNPIDWTCPVKFPKSLRNLVLRNTNIGENIHKLEFPDLIERLSLEVNQITSIDNVRFPQKLNILGIGSNSIRTVRNLMVPKTCQTIHFTENRLSGKIDLSKNIWGEELECWYLYLNFNKFTSYKDVKLPHNLKILNFDDCKLTSLVDIEFQKSLVEMSFRGCEISTVSNVRFEENSHLKYLCLADNLLTKLHHKDLAIPNGVETLTFSGNKISQIQENYFKLSESLSLVNISGNRLGSVNLSFFNSVEIIDLSFNILKQFKISFPRYCDTKLTSVNLSSNRLLSFDIEKLGHGIEGTRHNQLIEIDITDNSIDIQETVKNLDRLPKSMECLFIGHAEEQDKFGYDIGENVLNSNIYLGKRIDLSNI